MEQYISNLEISYDNLLNLFNNVIKVARETVEKRGPNCIGVSVVSGLSIENNSGYMEKMRNYNKFSFYCKAICDDLGFKYSFKKSPVYDDSTHHIIATNIEERFSLSNAVLSTTDDARVSQVIEKALKK